MKAVVNAALEQVVPAEYKYDKAYHHSPGSLTSAIGSSQLMWLPRSKSNGFFDGTKTSKSALQEKVAGMMTLQILSLEYMNCERDRDVYVRLGCSLPVGAQSGRWPRYHTKPTTMVENLFTWNEEIRVAIVEYRDIDENITVYPQVTLSIRLKHGGWFGASSDLTHIICIPIQDFWTNVEEPASVDVKIPLTSKNKPTEEAEIFISLRFLFTPIPDKQSDLSGWTKVIDTSRDLALLSTYKSKVNCSPAQN